MDDFPTWSTLIWATMDRWEIWLLSMVFSEYAFAKAWYAITWCRWLYLRVCV